MTDFEYRLNECRGALERFVKFRIADPHDAEDVIQEIYLTAIEAQDRLRNPDAFKPWLLGIARNLCARYAREKAGRREIPSDRLDERIGVMSRFGRGEPSAVADTLARLGEKDRQILWLCYCRELPQAEIAALLSIPPGTVKSRLHHARERFRAIYPDAETKRTKEGDSMKKITKFPEILPEYTIEKSDLDPFSVKWEEIMGWFIVPREGERLSWAMYDQPERRRGEIMMLEAVGRAEIHGIEGVEIAVREYDPMPCNSAGGQNPVDRRLVACLTDSHCRILAESHREGGVRRCYTFLDGDPFLNNWGFGENNCGNEVNPTPKGDLIRTGDTVIAADKLFLLDVVGRYTVTLCGRAYDTICILDVETYDAGVVSEQFLDADGRTVLWRRFNRDDWRMDRYGKPWSRMLPRSDRLTVNGVTYVHWYDCITDRVL